MPEIRRFPVVERGLDDDQKRAAREKLGEHIRQARKGKGWTQRQLGEKVGVTTSTVCDWEKGRASPTSARLRALAQVLGERVSFLIADHLGNLDSIEGLGRQLGSRIGKRRLDALSHMPDAWLQREIDAIIGRYVADHGAPPAEPKIRRR